MAGRLSISLCMFAVGVAMMVAAGVAWSSGSAETAKGGTLRLGTVGDVDFVDPGLAYSTESSPLVYATCAKLFNYPDAPGAAGARLVPEVVRTARISRDGQMYTFDLKRTFRFHTGAPVTARSFADAFNRVANPRLGSFATEFMREIVGAVAVMQGKATAISGIRVLGPYRLQIRLTRPVGDFTARLTLPFFCPILPNSPVDPAGMNNPPGSGPYYVAERIVNRRIVLKRNPYYQGGRPANVNQVVWTIGESEQACLLATEQNRIDHCDRLIALPPTTIRRLGQQYGINRRGGQFFVSPSLWTFYLAFNHDRRAFKGSGQIPLKKAINYAIDRPALARVYGYLAGKRTDQILPPALGRDASIYPLGGADVATARKWYARAGHKPRTLVFYTRNHRNGVGVAEVLEFNLNRIGIDLDVKYYSDGTMLEKIATRGEPFDMASVAWGLDYADAGQTFEGLLNPDLRATGNGNSSYFKDARVTARIEAASRLSGAPRRKAWADLEVDLTRNDPPWASYMNVNDRNFVSRSYGCFLNHPVYGLDIAAACKK